MRIFVSGSNGFIGKRLVELLKKKGHEVKGYDLPNDICNFAQLKKEMHGCKVVYHLAALLDETKPKPELFRVNVKGTEAILKAATENSVDRFIYLSTVGVHGNTSEILDENSPFSPSTPYEESKAEAEKLVFGHQELLPITILRSALVYGANEYWEKIVKLVKKGFPIIGSGLNKWQLIYVDDLVSALVFVIHKDETLGETYIVAEEHPHTFIEIYKSIQKASGIEKPIGFMAPFVAMVYAYFNLLLLKFTGKKSLIIPQHIKRLLRDRLYKTEKIRKLGWKAMNSLDEGMKKTVKELSSE